MPASPNPHKSLNHLILPQSTPISSSPTTRRRRRSPSPLIAFSPTHLPSDNGVQNITRKVIKRLEGLGHLEMVDLYLTTPEEETDRSNNASDVEREVVERALNMERDSSVGRLVPLPLNGSAAPGTANGHGHGRVNGGAVKSGNNKVDWEVPRKLLHSSIGFVTLYLYISEGDVSKVVFVLWSALCIIVPADLLRLRWPAFEKLYERFLGFLMRDSEKNSINGVIWYILGVNFALTFYPKDIATVAILILSWADTAASTLGRLYGPSSPRLPSRLPFLRIPLAPRKSLAGFLAASVTGAMIAVGFWTLIAPMRLGGREVSWCWDEGVRIGSSGLVGGSARGEFGGFGKGWIGLGVLSIFAGFVSGVAEAMDLGALDDNLTLPIISGGCIFGFLRCLGWIGSRLMAATSTPS